MKKESPDYVKMSYASAISLGLKRGRMYRGAVNRCVNLLVHYPEGCAANCAYCGLAKKRPGTYTEKSFIHVDWPVYSMDEIMIAVNRASQSVKRICISMITHGKCLEDTQHMVRRLSQETELPLSVLICPTIMDREGLMNLKRGGVDKIGVALDLATPELFERYRGGGVSGPHRFTRYWEMMMIGLEIFGPYQVGAHLMVGMGETEEQMVRLMNQLWKEGIANHLFSFFAEKGTPLSDRPPPPWSSYLRIQLSRYLIERGLDNPDSMVFDRSGRIVRFGIEPRELDSIIKKGIPFMTTGCIDGNGEVACNRPFGNCLPDVRQWNYPYRLNKEEISLVRQSIFH